MKAAHGYSGRRILLLTQHGKETVMAPLFAASLDARLERAMGFDTDTLGTFTRDVARRGTQLEAARVKARAGMALLGLDCGVASEGCFGPGPFGLFPANLELVVLIDDARDIEIVGRAWGACHHLHEQVATRDALVDFARRAGFPDHGLVVRPDDDEDARIRKGLADWSSLLEAFDSARVESRTSTVFVESDLRAHMNPTRMEVIRRATEDLIARLQSRCPRCGAPGFWSVARIAGLPCRECGSPTSETSAEQWKCVTGDHSEVRDLGAGRLADPVRCDCCNP